MMDYVCAINNDLRKIVLLTSTQLVSQGQWGSVF